MITLQVDGREMTFSEKELVAIVKEHLANKAAMEEKAAQKPTEGKWFQVNPCAINQELFQKKREDESQEETRQHILAAFAEARNNPEKYGKPFKTLRPQKTWHSTTVWELKRLAKKLGDHNANWVEQALEWAQRIQNGETWETICNEPDTANWHRLVVWKTGYAHAVGGACWCYNTSPAAYVSGLGYGLGGEFYDTVPLVVSYTQ